MKQVVKDKPIKVHKLLGQGRTADIFEHQEDDNMIVKLYKMSFPEDAVNQEFQISNIVFFRAIHLNQLS